MRSMMPCVFTLAVLGSVTMQAQDIAGDWQATLHRGTENIRTIDRIVKQDDGAWRVWALPIGQRGFDSPATASSVSFRDSVLTIAFDELAGVYAGKLCPDGNSIKGTWTQRGVPTI